MKKIMFNDRYGLTQAVLDGRKIMTRRLVTMTLFRRESGRMIGISPDDMFIDDNGKAHFRVGDRVFLVPSHNQPNYHVGEEVALAQPYRTLMDQGYLGRDGDGWISESFCRSPGYYNKMFVRAEYLPHHIIIRKAGVQRLQRISDGDCMKEGVEKWMDSFIVSGIMEGTTRKNNILFDSPREAYVELIDRISGRGTWRSNPWVYVYEFELIS